MPGLVSPVADEREGLLAFLAQQRYALRVAAFGLTDAQAVSAPAASELTVAGLIKHSTAVERSWMDTVRGRPSGSQDEYEDNFKLGPAESLASVLEDFDRAGEETERLIAGIDDLGRAVPVPPGVPWFPDDVDAWSVRWVLLHLIEEHAHHAGHADIVRESIDGATYYSLMAAAEAWPASEWLQPWEPATV
jgi:uncharacterized damage-inducible protein DinB